MDDANPIIVALLCVARCLIPLAIILGVSYLLRRFGLISRPAQPPAEYLKGENNNGE